MDLQLEGKRAIVTGGSRGIGKAIAKELAREGARVVIAARELRALEASAEQIQSDVGSQVFAAQVDTGLDESVKQMVARAVDALGGVDILVNAAAEPGSASSAMTVDELDDTTAWRNLNVKVLGYLRCIREVTPHMALSGGGRIVNISGLAARETGSAIGSVRNVAVVALTVNVAVELAAKGISAVVVHPGTTRTERTQDAIRAASERLGLSEAVIEERMSSENLLGRLVDAQEIAWIVSFLCSPKAFAINGEVIAAGGGTRGPIYY